MYWTRIDVVNGGGLVRKGGMDGSNSTDIISGSGNADGIVIDYQSRRIYWTHYDDIVGACIIKASNLDGSHTVIIHQLPAACADFSPHGIALVGNRLYWGNYFSNRIESSSTQPGSEIRVEPA